MLQEILKILEKDSRTTIRQIATVTDMSESEVENTIREAEEDQIILKYKTIINWDKVENEHVFALIEVKIAPQREVGFDSIAGKTIQQIPSFVSQKLAPIEGVQSTVTHFMLKKYKEDGEILGAREEIKRQPYLP
jgi:DNA-binding Lrp family transcriptional regulator